MLGPRRPHPSEEAGSVPGARAASARPVRQCRRGPAPSGASGPALLPAPWDAETVSPSQEQRARELRNGPPRSAPKPAALGVHCCLPGSCGSEIPESIRREVRDDVWSDGRPGRAVGARPVKVKLKPGAKAQRLKPRPLSRCDRRVMDHLIARYLEYELIRPCKSPYSSPVFLKRRQGTKDYHIVQDLKVINQMVQDMDPVKRNSRTIVNQLSEHFGWFTVLSLKDAFYCIPLRKKSQKLFAFEWGGPRAGRKKQYCWTVLPLGFKNAPAIFDDVFAKDLRALQLEEGVPLHYMGSILIASRTWEFSHKNTVRTLNFLAERGYKVCKKAQFSQETVKYLGLQLSRGQRRLLPEQLWALAREAPPATRAQLRTFLGKAGVCRIWVPNFGLIVRPLCEALKGDGESLNWTAECSQAFEDLKDRFSKASVLSLPDLRKPFDLFVHERKGIGLGVLTQGITRCPVAYCSKQLDAVARNWPACLRAVAAAHELLQQAQKFTGAQQVTVHTPHLLRPLLEQEGPRRLRPARLKKYRDSLLGDIQLKTVSVLHPDTLLPDPRGQPAHNCLQVGNLSSSADLAYQLLHSAGPEMLVMGPGRSWAPVLCQSLAHLSLGMGAGQP